VLERAEGRLDHARLLLELGAALRPAGVRIEARSVLRAALHETARLGPTGLADPGTRSRSPSAPDRNATVASCRDVSR
jgi:hypothetical protein